MKGVNLCKPSPKFANLGYDWLDCRLVKDSTSYCALYILGDRKLAIKNFKKLTVKKYQKDPIPSWFSRMIQNKLVKIKNNKVSVTTKGHILYSACELDLPINAFLILSLVYMKVLTFGKYYKSGVDFVNFYKLSNFNYHLFEYNFKKLSNKKIIVPYDPKHKLRWTIADMVTIKKYHKVLVGIYTYMVNA